MCGICGILYVDGRAGVDAGILAQMNRQIVHRGPDDYGMFVEGSVGLAMRRLSIIDVECGHQPISNEDGTLQIVYNGEIYNHGDLRRDLERKGHTYRTHSDTETIVHLYEEYGRECVRHLRGMFAFAIWDRRVRRLFLARDRMGIKPLYYRFDGRSFVFGSEIKAILAFPGTEAEFSRSVIGEYLAFGYLCGSSTMFSGIHKLLPGTTLEIDERGRVETREYWDLRNRLETETKTFEDYVTTYRKMLEESVSSHLMSDVPLGVFLSGGLDSSAVAALATKALGEPVQTFSVGYPEDAFSELPYARAVAKHLKSIHHEVSVTREAFFDALPELIWHEDEPLAWPSSVSLYFVARLAREHVKVVLTGEGSDETLAGYDRYAWTLLNARLDPFYRSITPAFVRKWIRDTINTSPVLPASLARKLRHTFVGRNGASWESLYFDNFYSAFSQADQAALLSDDARRGIDDPYAASSTYWHGYTGGVLHKMLYTDIKTYLQELLMKQDQMSMAASVESRVPFLDHLLVEFTASIPPDFLVKGFSGKHILKSAMADLLPRTIIDRKKMGFPTPWSQWLAGPQLESVKRVLLDRRAAERGLFRMSEVERICEEHRAGFRDHSTRLWRLLNLELWHRTCIDGQKHSAVMAGA